MSVDKKKLWLLLVALALILVLVLVLCVTSCEDKKGKLPQVGLCLRQYEADSEYGRLLEKCLTEAGYQVRVQDAMNDQTRQTEQIKALLDEGVVLLVIEPVIAEAAEDTVSLLMKENVPAVFVGNKPEKAMGMWNRLSFVGSAEDQLGQLQGGIILQVDNRGDLNEDGQVSCLVISGPEDDTKAKSQAEGCINVLVTEGLLVEQIQTSWGDWTGESGRLRCAKALSQYGKDIEVIFCGNEEITLGALDAVRSGGWQIGRDYYLAGVGAVEKLHTDYMTGTVVYDLEKMAQQVLSTGKALINGETVEREYYVNLYVLTAETDLE